ncbi:endonuclease domain-containing 1 protein-like, partial [Boleophthalmus pectinirostris]|uniref:endonuclease domain-containing 1 protein-like n=1 Tax=Boleophthalmus pectinirostris TaxID=150288 RepID=UPI00242E09A1
QDVTQRKYPIWNQFGCLFQKAQGTPPQGFIGAGLEPICQRFRNQYHFATLYHRDHRVPLFSAYILKPANGKRPNATWMYEPQLVFSRANPEMQFLPYPLTENNIIESQAVLQDYKNSNYTKGHLNPSMHQETKNNRMATFTLTNIVPQRAGSNSGPWSQLELEMLKKFKRGCIGPMYVITGALPYKNSQRWVNNRVLIPEYMWSAYCCPSYNNSVSERAHFPTYAAIGRNDRHSDQEIVPVNAQVKRSKWGYDVRRMSLEDLEEVLTQRVGTPVHLFQDQCQQQATTTSTITAQNEFLKIVEEMAS